MELKILLFVHILGICSGLRQVRIQVPQAVYKGSTAVLNCHYDIQGDPLYTVKWYKEQKEFYRFTPREEPVVKTFPIGNLTVKKAESNATRVTLENVQLDAAGLYSCEVSADAPSFHTIMVTSTMNVVELPSRTPTIQGLQRKYRAGDTLRLNCTSGHSKPPANLTWFVNDNKVRTYTSLDTNEPDRQAPQSGLQYLLSHEDFKRGKLKIRCIASIFDIYWQSTEVSAEEDRPKVVHFEPAATIVGINYLQPPPNFQTGQKKPDGQVDVKVLGSSGPQLQPFLRLFYKLFALLVLVIR